jgi:hypothetical protein
MACCQETNHPKQGSIAPINNNNRIFRLVIIKNDNQQQNDEKKKIIQLTPLLNTLA